MAFCSTETATGWLTIVDEACLLQVPRLATLLSAEEQTRAGRLLFEEDRALRIVARAHVRTVLSQYADISPEAWRFKTTEMGRPLVTNALPFPMFFSLTHTRGLVASVVWSQPQCGIDAERLDRKLEAISLARHSFAPTESAELEPLSAEQRQHRFLQLWTLKEAFAKAMGQGLSLGLDRACFSDLEHPIRPVFDVALGEDATRWSFRTEQPTEWHLVSVALRDSVGSFALNPVVL